MHSFSVIASTCHLHFLTFCKGTNLPAHGTVLRACALTFHTFLAKCWCQKEFLTHALRCESKRGVWGGKGAGLSVGYPISEGIEAGHALAGRRARQRSAKVIT